MQKKHWKLSPNLCKNLPPMSAPSEKTFQRRFGSWSYRNWNEDFSWRKPGVGFPPHFFCRYHVTAVRRPTGRTGVSSRQPASDTILNRGRVKFDWSYHLAAPKRWRKLDIFHQPSSMAGRKIVGLSAWNIGFFQAMARILGGLETSDFFTIWSLENPVELSLTHWIHRKV